MHPGATEVIPTKAESKPGTPTTAEPFEESQAPAKAPEEIAAPTSPPAGRSKTGLVLLFLLGIVLAFLAGYFVGRQDPELDPPVSTTKQPQSTDNLEPVSIPVRTYLPEAAPPAEDSPKIAGPEATLRAFLGADGWEARSAFVLFPDSIRPLMEARSRKLGDGPIEAEEVSLFGVTPNAHIFKVATSEVPTGFPVAVARNDDNWLVDWKTFMEFHDNQFAQFAAGKGEPQGVFHLLIKPLKSESEETLFESFLLNPPLPDHEQRAYVAKASVAHARIRSIFDRKTGFSENLFESLLEKKGPPMVLALSYKKNSAGQSYLQIDDVVAIGWSPVEP